jgi:hypothetical protein
MMSTCSICEKSIYPGEYTKADQDGVFVHLRCWHYEIASIKCKVCGSALSDDEFEIALAQEDMVCARC